MSRDATVPKLFADPPEQALGHTAPLRWEDAIEILADYSGVSKEEAEKMLTSQHSFQHSFWYAFGYGHR